MTGPFPHVRVHGGARARGTAYGEEARERVRRSVDAYREVFLADAGWDWTQVTEHALGYTDAIVRFEPRYLEEIAGIAAGAGLAMEDILAINVRTEVMFAAKARQAADPSRRPGECTAFAVTPERSADGHTLLGQNWDWLPHAEETVIVLEAEQDDGPGYVTVVEAGLLAKTGMNASGIGLVTNALVSDGDRGATWYGIPGRFRRPIPHVPDRRGVAAHEPFPVTGVPRPGRGALGDAGQPVQTGADRGHGRGGRAVVAGHVPARAFGPRQPSVGRVLSSR